MHTTLDMLITALTRNSNITIGMRDSERKIGFKLGLPEIIAQLEMIKVNEEDREETLADDEEFANVRRP
ncbi:hypothetical protein [Candidatus Enterovibrio escicola]|uniref:hypothetical protein n=1 Tax=Candidatus Enterovibrio escicola TaxID=1927127 RepID=UPI001237CA6C|nr:hypothetical protein [Candidatus Enterovibrio escacola]